LALIPIEGSEKTTRGVNEGQSNFLDGTCPISQIEPDAPLFELGQDHTAIARLSALRTGSGTAAEIRNGTNKTTSEINDKNRLKEQFISSHVFHRTPGGRVKKIIAEERFEP
jgi:hypothetical protein